MNLPDGFKRAGREIGPYPDTVLDLLEIKYDTTSGQVIVGITEWFGKMCEEGDVTALALLSSLPQLVKDATEQHVKVQ